MQFSKSLFGGMGGTPRFIYEALWHLELEPWLVKLGFPKPLNNFCAL
jgi:hypothetical protein